MPAGLRAAWGAMLALMLALRLITPAGFMPSFEGGAVSIVTCPGAMPMHGAGQHEHGKTSNAQLPCPYAAASATGALGPDAALALAPMLFGAVLLPWQVVQFAERMRSGERPPSRAPPLRA